MTKNQFKKLKVGDRVRDELTCDSIEIVDIDENGFMLADGVYHCGDSIKRFTLNKPAKEENKSKNIL